MGIMGIGPVPAIGAMMDKTGVSLGEVDTIEINEAFPAQTVSCQKALDIPLEKLNTCGGAVALGHPLASSGGRVRSTALDLLVLVGVRALPSSLRRCKIFI